MFQGALYIVLMSRHLSIPQGVDFFVYFLLVMHCSEEFEVSDAVVSVHSSRVKTTGHITK